MTRYRPVPGTARPTRACPLREGCTYRVAGRVAPLVWHLTLRHGPGAWPAYWWTIGDRVSAVVFAVGAVFCLGCVIGMVRMALDGLL